MAEYIERQKAIDLFFPVDPENDGSDGTTLVCQSLNYSSADIESKLSDMPTEDVAPVRHGRWEFLGPNRLAGDCKCGTCSVCKVRCKYIVNQYICPSCGAKMDLEVPENETI